MIDPNPTQHDDPRERLRRPTPRLSVDQIKHRRATTWDSAAPSVVETETPEEFEPAPTGDPFGVDPLVEEPAEEFVADLGDTEILPPPPTEGFATEPEAEAAPAPEGGWSVPPEGEPVYFTPEQRAWFEKFPEDTPPPPPPPPDDPLIAVDPIDEDYASMPPPPMPPADAPPPPAYSQTPVVMPEADVPMTIDPPDDEDDYVAPVQKDGRLKRRRGRKGKSADGTPKKGRFARTPKNERPLDVKIATEEWEEDGPSRKARSKGKGKSERPIAPYERSRIVAVIGIAILVVLVLLVFAGSFGQVGPFAELLGVATSPVDVVFGASGP